MKDAQGGCTDATGVSWGGFFKGGNMRREPLRPLDGWKVPLWSGGVTKPKESVRCVCSGFWNLSKICNFPLAFPQRN